MVADKLEIDFGFDDGPPESVQQRRASKISSIASSELSQEEQGVLRAFDTAV